MLNLSNLRPKKGANFEGKRVGRGIGSGWGKTAGRGHKGQNARSGGSKEVWFEGGQTPIYRRLPKRGFNNPFATEYEEVKLSDIDRKFSEGEVVSKETLISKGLVRRKYLPVKILGNGELTKKLVFKNIDKFTRSALKKIEASGSSVE